MKKLLAQVLLFPIFFISSCSGQTSPPSSSQPATLVGGGCDGCEIMYVGMPEQIGASDTSAAWQEQGRKILISGKVLKKDGRTPAPGVILYYWQTDQTGKYVAGESGKDAASRHGRLRGWMKTDREGNYALYTIRPGNYPGESFPAHIHIAIKEPGVLNEYYIDDLVFDDDPYLSKAYKDQQQKRGGNGILKLAKSGNVETATYNIVLGLNIPGYPADSY
ncbi:MAG: intradiol ring-cleavage dioxygenase [Flavisolibacter sp.]|jgi:protocatechuate 3,4-dioxygenase beta subunit|nr:intradiol ring-cleavage dioxygenase [Flavisolibacter sp.]